MLQERESLKQELKGANDKVFAKAGEVSIVRTKLEKTSKEYESQLQTLQRERLAEKARHNAELAKIQAERERIATDNMFLQHNAGEKASFAARPPGNIQKEASGRGSMTNGVQNGNKVLTPKKSIELPFRDGFESHEILLLSPSKSMTRSKPGTPKAGLKRKRKVEASPGQPLELSQPRQHSPSSKPQQVQKPVVPKEEVLIIEKEDKRFSVTTITPPWGMYELMMDSSTKWLLTIAKSRARSDRSKNCRPLHFLRNQMLHYLHFF